jgi:hypothetical protein
MQIELSSEFLNEVAIKRQSDLNQTALQVRDLSLRISLAWWFPGLSVLVGPTNAETP